MGKVLTIFNAEVKTAGVQIKTLTIEGKQVTLAVFRQLWKRPLIDKATGNLNGMPWGLVNYHPDGCKRTHRHYHVVWQLGAELYRDNVLQLSGKDTSDFEDIWTKYGNPKEEPSEEWVNKIKSQLTAIAELPQIFIAV